MQSIQQILQQMAPQYPVIQQAMSQGQNHSEIIIPDSDKIAKLHSLCRTKQIEILDASVAVLIPEHCPNQAQALGQEMSDWFGGASCFSGVKGLWNNAEHELIVDAMMLVKSYTTVAKMMEYLPLFLNQVAYWGGMCEQEVMAVEVGTLMGNLMLLVPGG